MTDRDQPPDFEQAKRESTELLRRALELETSPKVESLARRWAAMAPADREGEWLGLGEAERRALRALLAAGSSSGA